MCIRDRVCAPVLWNPLMDKMLAEGYDEFYEVGTGKVLKGLLKRIARKTKIHSTLESGVQSVIPAPKMLSAKNEKVEDEHNHSQTK